MLGGEGSIPARFSPRMSSPGCHSARFADKQGQMADDQNEKAHVIRCPGPLVGPTPEAKERRREEDIEREIEELGRALESRDRRVSLSTAERAKSSPAQERARTQALEQQQAAREDEQKLLEQQLAAREDEQKLMAQERARAQTLEQQLAVARRNATLLRDRTATTSPSDRPASTPLTPAPEKLVTARLLANDKQVMPAKQKSRTRMARPISVVLAAVLLVVGGYLVGRLSTPDNDMRPARTLGAPQPEVSAPPPQEVTSGNAPRDAATAPAEMSAATKATPEVTEPKVIEKPSAKSQPLSSSELRELQAWLKVLGFDPGPADGLVGDRTTAAIRHYQSARHLEETGVPDQTLLRQVRKDVGH